MDWDCMNQPPDSPDCVHKLCDFCGECHTEECDLAHAVCANARLLAFCLDQEQKATNGNIRQRWAFYARAVDDCEIEYVIKQAERIKKDIEDNADNVIVNYIVASNFLKEAEKK